MAELRDGELDTLIEDATVDAHDEQPAGFRAAIEGRLAVPFRTTKIDLLPGSGIAAACSRGKHRQAIGILDVLLPAPPPAGAEWISAAQRWAP